jgi:hypothetical protein
MSGATSKAEVVAAAAAKWFRALVDNYHGPPDGLRGYLLRELSKHDRRADEILAGTIREIGVRHRFREHAGALLFIVVKRKVELSMSSLSTSSIGKLGRHDSP